MMYVTGQDRQRAECILCHDILWKIYFSSPSSYFPRDLLLLLLRWRCSPGWALASFTIRLQASWSLALSLHSFIPIFLRSVDTSSSHLIFGLPLRLVACSFPYTYNIFFGIAVSCILSVWPSHPILWHLMNLTMFSPFITDFPRDLYIKTLSVFTVSSPFPSSTNFHQNNLCAVRD